MGSDPDPHRRSDGRPYFNSRSPCGERPGRRPLRPAGRPISTHAPRVGSDADDGETWTFDHISTHAPRVGSDHLSRRVHRPARISTHAPRVGSDQPVQEPTPQNPISTHAPRVGSDRQHMQEYWDDLEISTHAPRVGSDTPTCTIRRNN